jgi:hypothetical protein
VLGEVLTWDSSCGDAALATCNCHVAIRDFTARRRTAAPRSSRVTITPADSWRAGEIWGAESKALGSLITRLQNVVLNIKDVHALGAGEGYSSGGRGFLAVAVAAALSQRPGLVEGALDLATALVAGALGRGCQMSLMMPLVTSGALAHFLATPAPPRLKSLGLLRMLIEDPEILAALSDTLRAGGADTEHEGRTNGNNQRNLGTMRAGRAGGDSAANSGAGKRSREKTYEEEGSRAGMEEWVGPVLNAVLDSLQIVTQTNRSDADGKNSSTIVPDTDDETCLARASLSIIAHLLLRGAFPALLALLQRGGGGAKASQKTTTTKTRAHTDSLVCIGHRPLAVRLMLLAEEAIMRRGDDQELTPGAPAPWPTQGGRYSRLADQVEWQRRLRLAQEALTLLRGLMNASNAAVAQAALEGLLSSAAVMQRVLTATSRMIRMEAPPLETAEPIERESWAAALPVAAWAYAIGSSSAAHSLAPPQAAMMRGGLPCCSVADVAHLARGIRAYVVNNHDR